MSLPTFSSYCTTKGENLICDGCNMKPGTKTLHQPFRYGNENICGLCYAVYKECNTCSNKDINDKCKAHTLCIECKGKMTNRM